MGIFSRKKTKSKSYDPENQIPVIRASICTGEQVAGFKNIHTGTFEDVMLIRNNTDLQMFKDMYGITGEVEKIY